MSVWKELNSFFSRNCLKKTKLYPLVTSDVFELAYSDYLANEDGPGLEKGNGKQRQDVFQLCPSVECTNGLK